MRIARMIYRILRVFYGKDWIITTRKNITYRLNISEGIDLYIFLFGQFQAHVFGGELMDRMSEKPIILDVGANIGAMSLSYAQKFPAATIYSFEPTDSAWAKLQDNLALNPTLAPRIHSIKCFVGASSEKNSSLQAYSSWPLINTGSSIHPMHGGKIQSADNTPTISLDDFVYRHQISHVDFIKIDTDGHELAVLLGGKELITKFRPSIIFEIGLYIIQEHNQTIDMFFDFFDAQRYTLTNLKTSRIVTRENYQKEIPMNGTTDLLALPITI
jgi:FkbM family methyltransferase